MIIIKEQACQNNIGGLAAFLLLAVSSVTYGGAVFDGSIGPNAAGTVRAGAFEITEADGQLSGNNVFQSFSAFDVQGGEVAVFSHSTAGVENIIARVSGLTATEINGAIGVQEGVGGLGVPTSAVLWLLNPNGIVIQENALFDISSSFRFSTANEIQFSNGDSFYSHEVTHASTLSVANPIAFGFLSGDQLPDGLTPDGAAIEIVDAGNANAALFLSDMMLVGTATDPSEAGLEITGDVVAGFDPTSPIAPADSSQIQSFSLRLYAMGPGEVLNVSNPVDYTGSESGSGIVIRNGNFLTADFFVTSESNMELGGRTIEISDSFIQGSAGAVASDILITASEAISFSDSSAQTSTVTGVNAGGLEISAAVINGEGSVLGSQIVDFVGSGDAGDVLISTDTGAIDFADTSVISLVNGTGAGGNITVESATDLGFSAQGFPIILTNSSNATDAGTVSLNADGDISITGAYSIRSDTTDSGNAGNIVVSASNITLAGTTTDDLELSSSTLGAGQAGEVQVLASQDQSLDAVSIFSVTAFDGVAGDVLLEANNLSVNDTSIATTTLSTNPADAPATVTLNADGDLVISQSSIQSSSAGAARAGEIALTAGSDLSISDSDVQSGSVASGSSGNIVITAGNAQTIQGDTTLILTNATDSGDAGNISLSAASILLTDDYTIQTSSEGTGDAGTILISADDLNIEAGRIESASAIAGGGDIDLFGRAVLLNGDAANSNVVVIIADSFSSDAQGNGGSITLGDPASPADTVVVRSSALSASAQQGNGGQININAASFIRDARSVFQVTSVSGEPGALEINAPEQDVSTAVTALEAPLPDSAALVADICDQQGSDRSRLLLVPSKRTWQPDDYLVGNGVVDPTVGLVESNVYRVACR